MDHLLYHNMPPKTVKKAPAAGAKKTAAAKKPAATKNPASEKKEEPKAEGMHSVEHNIHWFNLL